METTTPHRKGRLPPKRKNTSNGNLRWRSIVTKDTNDQKRVTTSRRKTEETENGGSLPKQPGQRRGTQVEGTAPTHEKAGQPCGSTQAEAHSISQRQWNRTKTKSKPNQRRESHVTIVDRGRTQTGPDQKTRNTTGPRRPEAQQHYEGKPTST